MKGEWSLNPFSLELIRMIRYSEGQGIDSENAMNTSM